MNFLMFQLVLEKAAAALLQPVLSLLPLPDSILRALFFARLRRRMLLEGPR